jgi:membrane-bound metal-dependent hydrolase YbcI (DUF457 family)
MLWVLFAAGGTLINPVTLLIGSVLPDADHRHAPMGRIFPLWLIFRHRSWTHTIQAWAVVSAACWAIWGWRAGAGMFIGYGSHLMLDACTPSGVKWLGPKRK